MRAHESGIEKNERRESARSLVFTADSTVVESRGIPGRFSSLFSLLSARRCVYTEAAKKTWKRSRKRRETGESEQAQAKE